MNQPASPPPPLRRTRPLAWLGYLLLVALLPVAAMALLADANSYRAQGIGAIDCDGPMRVLMFAIPAVFAYGAGAVIHGLGRRFVVAALCAAVCVPLAFKMADALGESRKNDREPACNSQPPARHR